MNANGGGLFIRHREALSCIYNALAICKAGRWDNVVHVFRACTLVGLRGTQDKLACFAIVTRLEFFLRFRWSQVRGRVHAQGELHRWLIAVSSQNTWFNMSFQCLSFDSRLCRSRSLQGSYQKRRRDRGLCAIRLNLGCRLCKV